MLLVPLNLDAIPMRQDHSFSFRENVIFSRLFGGLPSSSSSFSDAFFFFKPGAFVLVALVGVG